jgi:hypothetical protein
MHFVFISLILFHVSSKNNILNLTEMWRHDI